VILPHLDDLRAPPLFGLDVFEPGDMPPPAWIWAVALGSLALAAAAFLLEAPAVAARWAWAPAVAPAFLVLPWRGWPGAVVAGVLGALVAAVCGWAGAGAVPWATVVTVALTSGGLAGAEALRRHRWRAALLDPDTGLPSRRVAEAMLEHELAAARRGRPLSVVLLGVENGHLAPEVAAETVIREQARYMDIFGRYDRGVFVAILPCEEMRGAVAFARRMRKAADEVARATGALRPMSAGIAAYRTDAVSERSLLEEAAEALEEARRRGGGRIVVRGEDGFVEAEREE